MGFPGRLQEKRVNYVFWAFVVGFGILIGWGSLAVMKAIHDPLPKRPSTPKVVSTETPGLIRKTATDFEKNAKQIIDGKPLERPKETPPVGRAVTLSEEKDPGDGKYYRDR